MSKLSDAIPNRIRALRQERGWTLAELAKRAETSAPQVMRIEQSSRQLTTDWIERFAAAFGIDPIELMFKTERSTTVEMPLIGAIRAGNWEEAVAEAEDTVPVPASMAGSGRSFALRVKGTSMDLIVPEGGIVVVDPNDDELRDGKTYAVMNDEGETTVKRYRASPSRLEPVSTDQSHKPFILGRHPFTVIGRVRAAITEM